MTFVRDAKRPAYRSRSREKLTPSPTGVSPPGGRRGGAPAGLSSCARRVPPSSSPMSLFLDIGTGSGWPAPPACAPSCRRSWPGRWRAATWASTSAEPTGASSSRRVPGGRARAGLASYAVDRSAPGTPGGRSPARRAAAARRRARSAPVRGFAGGRRQPPLGLVAGALCALLARVAVGGVLERARRRLDAGAAGLLTSYADCAALCSPRRGVRSSALVPSADRLRRVCSSAAGAARARSTPACGYCARSAGGEAEEAGPGGHRLAQAGHARPRHRGGPRAGLGGAPASGAPMSATACPRFPSVTPVASAAIATGAAPGAPHPLDELVPPRGGALHRVRLVLPGHARVRRRPLALRHGLQHEHGAPEQRPQDGLRAP